MNISELTCPGTPGEDLYVWDLIERLLRLAATAENFNQFSNLPGYAEVNDRIVARWQIRPSDVAKHEQHLSKWLVNPYTNAPRPPVFGDAEILKQLNAALAESFRDIDASLVPYVAYAVAESLDEIYAGAAFEYEPVRRRFVGEPAIAPGTLIPTPRAPKTDHLPPSLRSFEADPRVLHHCRLAPDEKHYRLVVSTMNYESLGNALGSQKARCAIAVLGSRTEWDFNTVSIKASPYFYGVRPSLADRWNRLERVLRYSASRNVSILILPELCLVPSEQDQIVELLRTDAQFNGASLKVVVVGSVHLCEGEDPEWRQANQVRTAIMGSASGLGPRVLSHRKFNAFVDRSSGREIRELLTPDPDVHEEGTITFHVGSQCSLVTLCCKDFLSLNTQSLLVDLQPTHVLIPALSTKLDPFNASAARLAKLSRGNVLIGNGYAAIPAGQKPAPHDGQLGLFAVADKRRRSAIVADLKKPDLRFPAICIFEPAEPPADDAVSQVVEPSAGAGVLKQSLRGDPEVIETAAEFTWYAVP